MKLLKTPLKVPPFFYYVDATKNSINQIAHILQRITSQPRLQILPLPPMLPQSQNENLQHQKIISTPAPATRLEPVSQPPRVQTQYSAPTPPPIDQPSTSPSLDPHSNPWIKISKNIRKHPRFSNPEKDKRHPGKFKTDHSGPHATLGQISAPKQHRTLFPTIYSIYRTLATSTIARVKRKL